MENLDAYELCKLYKYLRVVDVCDAMDGIGYFDIGLMSPEIRPIWSGIKFWGVAFTIRCVPANRPIKHTIMVIKNISRICLTVGILSLLLIFWGLILGCQSRHESDTQELIINWGEPSNGLRCSIIVEEKFWAIGEPVMVSVIVENISEGKVSLRTIPAFTLNEMQYWCPVDIVSEDHNLPANARSIISLEKGAQINSRIDISKLGWDRGISSIWPSQDLYSLVPTGKYKLRLNIEVVESVETQWIRSKEVAVEIGEKTR